jgi:long-chain acyl-CoA synthetase
MNIYDTILSNNQSNSTKIALAIEPPEQGYRSVTYSKMFEAVDRMAEALRTLGMRQGDRIALISENSPEWIISFLAVAKIRCTAVLIDVSLTPSDLLRYIEKSDLRLILISPRVRTGFDGLFLTDIPCADTTADAKLFADTGFSGKIRDEIIAGDETIAAIIYSSGTTRTPAGIMHSHDALIRSTLMCAECNNLDETDKYLSVVPNSHIYGLICLVLGPMLMRGDVFFIAENTPAQIMKAFAEYRPTIFPCVPRVFELFRTEIEKKIAADPKSAKLFRIFFPICLKLRQRTGINLGKKLFKAIHKGFGGKIEVFCSAGAPMDQKTAEFYLGTGFNMLITYGATETNIPTLGNYGKKLTADSCGRRYPDVSAKISDNGELLIRSDYMMKGYFGQPEMTAEAFEDGWFKTGDLCRIDPKGHFVITGRRKENIVLASGKKVTPEEVEAAYKSMPGVKEIIVAGVVVAGKGYDEVHAFIVPSDTGASREKIEDRIREMGTALPAHMRITTVHFMEEIPKTSLQKPKRYLLRKAAEEEMCRDAQNADADRSSLTDEEELIRIIARTIGWEESRIKPEYGLYTDLGIDSLQSIDLAISLEERFGFPVDKTFSRGTTVLDVLSLIKDRVGIKPDAVISSLYPRRKKFGDYFLFRQVSNLARLVYSIRFDNESVLPEDSGYILCANHVSNFDYLWLSAKFNRKRFEKFCCMAKTELFGKGGISRTLSQVCGMIPVDRVNFHSDTMKSCENILREKWGLLIHPEGTRSVDGELGAFKKGAAVLAIESGVPIIPAYIHGAYDIFPNNIKMPRLFNFRRMKKYAVNVFYGNPIFPNGQTADELIEQVKESILELKQTAVSRIKSWHAGTEKD